MGQSTRSRWVAAAALAAAALSGLLLAAEARRAPANAGAVAAETRPNILIILTDDQSADELANMPKARQWFGAGGTQFTDAYVTTPLCCPSRSTIFSGRYVHNHGNTQNDHPHNLDLTATFQRYLQDAGYATALDGKFLTGWRNSDNPPNFDRFTITAGGYYGAYFRSNDGPFQDPNMYSTTYLTQKALEDIDAFEQNDTQPWLLYVTPHAPHKDFTPETAYATAAVAPWNGNPAVTEADRTDKPPYVRANKVTLSQGRWLWQQQTRTLFSVDDMVDAIFRRLQARGEASNTLALYLSDNGFLHGEHGLKKKALPYTGSVQVPFFIRWPGRVRAGRTDNRFIANVDIAPSLLAAAGVSPTLKYPFDGRAMLSATGLTTATHDPLFLEYFFSPDFKNTPPWRSIRTKTYQYIQTQDANGAVTFREYYDLVNDPWQNENLLADGNPGNDPDVGVLDAQVATYAACVGTACP
jgi:arylsulfatase A-like enzyme